MKKVFFSIAVVLAGLCFLAGCVTSVPVTYTEPAKLDLSGVKRIAVDSVIFDDAQVETSVDAQVRTSVSQKISATGKYTVASAAELAQWKLWQHQRQAAEVGSAALVQAYGENVARADSTYKGKLLLITSAVQQIEQHPSGSYYVRFEGTGNNAVAVFFRPSEINQIRELNSGKTVTIIGECIGRTLPDMTDTAQILQILGGGQPIYITDATFQVEAPAVDAVIVLKVDGGVQNGSRTQQEAAVDADGKRITGADGKTVYRDVTIYERSAAINIGYGAMRAQDLSEIGKGNAPGTSGLSSNRDQSKLPAAAQLLATATEKALQEFNSAITPTQRSTSISLVKESDNSAAKKEMSGANKLVKAKDFAGAAAAYGAVYANYKNFAAGYNQAVLTEVSSGTAVALGLMEALATANPGNATAQTTLRNMQARNSANQRSAEQISN